MLREKKILGYLYIQIITGYILHTAWQHLSLCQQNTDWTRPYSMKCLQMRWKLTADLPTPSILRIFKNSIHLIKGQSEKTTKYQLNVEVSGLTGTCWIIIGNNQTFPSFEPPRQGWPPGSMQSWGAQGLNGLYKTYLCKNGNYIPSLIDTVLRGPQSYR